MNINLLAAWIGLLAGILAGAVIGLFFHRPNWLGGYDSFPRRMVRLGHISFIGLGILNALFALTCANEQLSGSAIAAASWMLVGGAATMPVCCFLCAWRKGFRHLFPIPVVLVTGSIVLLLYNW
ncbi:MAG: hypothetical protein R3282_00545 [Rhodothermales bacterium]|nr:hypothetical protein [Rhodothermales bacterium]